MFDAWRKIAQPKVIITLLGILAAVTMVTFTSLAITEDVGSMLEEMVLAKDTVQRDEIDAVLNNAKKYTKQGNFYAPKAPVRAFGHEVKYIGLMGIDLRVGPNLTLEANPTDVAETINTRWKTGLAGDDESFEYELRENLVLVVHQHPTEADWTIVHCVYTGP